MKFYFKKTTILFAFIAALSFNSCSDDSDSDFDTSGDLIGVWQGVDVDYSGNTVTSFAGQSETSDFVGEAYDVDYTITFTEDPNNVVSDGSYSVELTSTTLGQTNTQNFENLEFLENGSWSKSGNQLSIISNGVEQIMTILELTDTKLTLSITTVEDLSQSGVTITSTLDVITTYTRQ